MWTETKEYTALKITKTPVTKKRTIYYADDGSEHSTRDQAEKYEQELKNKNKWISMKVELSEKADRVFPDLYKLESLNDFNFLFDWMRLRSDSIIINDDEKNKIKFSKTPSVKAQKFLSTLTFPCIISLQNKETDPEYYGWDWCLYTEDYLKDKLQQMKSTLQEVGHTFGY